MIAAIPGRSIAGVLIDAVGTIIEPQPAVALAYAAAARRQGIELDPQTVRGRFRTAFSQDEVDEQRGPLATDEAIEHRRWRRIVAVCLPEAPDPDRAFDDLWAHFADPGHWRVFPDVAPALQALSQAGIAVRIGSNFDGRLRSVLAGLPELTPWADRVLISSEVGVRKPHPGFYDAALSSLGLPAADVVCVGDDRENDVRGPQRVGLHAVLLDRDAREPRDGRTPTVGDLLELAEQLLSGR